MVSIPEGYRELLPEDIVSFDDLYFSYYSNEWRAVSSSVGKEYSSVLKRGKRMKSDSRRIRRIELPERDMQQDIQDIPATQEGDIW